MCLFSFAQDEYIIPLDDISYRMAEELFLEAGWVPPLNQKPIIAARLKEQLGLLIDKGDLSAENIQAAKDLQKSLDKAMSPLTPILETAAWGQYSNKTDVKHEIYDGDTIPGMFVDYLSVYEVDDIPPLLKAGFMTQLNGFSVMFMPQLGPTLSTRMMDNAYFNYPRNPLKPDSFDLELKNIDNGMPYKGIATFFGYPVEFRIGRDKLQLGPALWSGMTLTQHMPFYDYAKAALYSEQISYSLYFIRLNPTISIAEGEKLDEYKENGAVLNPETYYYFVGQSYNERAKHLVVGSTDFTFFPFLHFELNQMDLISGRQPQLPDFNPFIVFHNLFMEGSYSVPFSFSITYTPLKGVKIFGEYYQYDMQSDEEPDVNLHPTALAYQAGFTLLSSPYFALGPGRFRLDGEFTHVDPWTYNLFHSYRKMTSRFIYVENYVGRLWIDFPIGYYLGPDCEDFHIALSYGIPGDWEAELGWNLSAIGEINLFGWGDNSQYAHIGDPGLEAKLKAPSGTVFWTNAFSLSGYKFLTPHLKLSSWLDLEHVVNRHNRLDDNHFFVSLGASVEWCLN